MITSLENTMTTLKTKRKQIKKTAILKKWCPAKQRAKPKTKAKAAIQPLLSLTQAQNLLLLLSD
jgi:hypothetical protein